MKENPTRVDTQFRRQRAENLGIGLWNSKCALPGNVEPLGTFVVTRPFMINDYSFGGPLDEPCYDPDGEESHDTKVGKLCYDPDGEENHDTKVGILLRSQRGSRRWGVLVDEDTKV